VIEHEPWERVHVAGKGKETLPASDCVNVTVPVGENPPDTVAMQVEAEPTANIVGKQETEVVVVPFVTVRPDVPELPWLFESPP